MPVTPDKPHSPLSLMEIGAIAAIVVIWGANNAAAKVATEVLPPLLTGADKTIITTGLVTEENITDSFNATGKGGTIVLTGLNKLSETNIKLPGTIMTLFKKTLKGSLFGDCNPTTDIPRILGLYQSGDIKLDEIITNTYTLDQVNEGYDDLLSGKNVRGVLIHEH